MDACTISDAGKRSCVVYELLLHTVLRSMRNVSCRLTCALGRPRAQAPQWRKGLRGATIHEHVDTTRDGRRRAQRMVHPTGTSSMASKRESPDRSHLARRPVTGLPGHGADLKFGSASAILIYMDRGR